MINLICAELFAECIADILYGPKKDIENAQSLLAGIVKMQSNYTKRICHPEPGMKPKLYFKDLREKFAAEVSEVLDQINS